MNCENCKNTLIEGQNICSFCGNEKGDIKLKIKKKKSQRNKIILIIASFMILALSRISYSFSVMDIVRLVNPRLHSLVSKGLNLDTDPAIEAFDSGDYDLAKIEMQKQLDLADTDVEKLNILKNQAYLYSSNLENEIAIETFKKALFYAQSNLFEKTLIQAEIDNLEYNFGRAEKLYLEAYALDKNNFQITNALSMFYLDLDDSHPALFDPIKGLEFALLANKQSDPAFRNSADQNLAIAYFYNDEFDHSIEIMQRQSQDDPYVLFWLGLAYLGKEDDTTAITFFERADSYSEFDLPEEIEGYIDEVNSQ